MFSTIHQSQLQVGDAWLCYAAAAMQLLLGFESSRIRERATFSLTKPGGQGSKHRVESLSNFAQSAYCFAQWQIRGPWNPGRGASKQYAERQRPTTTHGLEAHPQRPLR